jgi:transposase
VRETHEFKQAHPGRPRPDTAYRKITHHRYDIEWKIDHQAVDFDQKSDGIFPLLTNDRNLCPAEVLQADKGQPTIEKRFEQLKTVREIAPVFLKNPGRIEAFFTGYFLALLVQSLIEWHLRLAMQREQITHLPLYAERRQCRRPTTEQILRLFGLLERGTPCNADQRLLKSLTLSLRPCSARSSACSTCLQALSYYNKPR